MHFHSLAVLWIPQVEEDPEETARVVNELTSLELMEEIGPKNIMRQIFIRELKGQLNSFSREVYHRIEDLMHPYGSESEDCYEFCDQKGEVESAYENRSCDCVRLPDGRIISMYDSGVWGKYEIQNSQVFQKKAGPLQHLKRTHKAKKCVLCRIIRSKSCIRPCTNMLRITAIMSMMRRPAVTATTVIPMQCGTGTRLAVDGRLLSS